METETWKVIAGALLSIAFGLLKWWWWAQCHKPMTDFYDRPSSEQWLYDDSWEAEEKAAKRRNLHRFHRQS